MISNVMKQIEELLNATANIYDKILGSDLIGKIEKDIKRVIFAVYKERLGSFSFKGDIVAGKRSAVGEGDATDYIIKMATRSF